MLFLDWSSTVSKEGIFADSSCFKEEEEGGEEEEIFCLSLVDGGGGGEDMGLVRYFWIWRTG